MKKFSKRQMMFVVIICLGLSLFLSLAVFASNSLSDKLAGKILLQVEENGEAWYINPQSKTRSFLGRPEDAFSVMREQGVGISNDNLSKIPVSLDNLSGEDSDGDGLPDMLEDALSTDKNKQDSDGDSYSDKEELQNNYNPLGQGKLSLDQNFQNNQKGKIFLQVENNGEAWYISPEDGKRHFLGRPNDAFSVMRSQGLGISNSDIEKISVNKEISDIPDSKNSIDGNQLSSREELISFAKNMLHTCSNASAVFRSSDDIGSNEYWKLSTKSKNGDMCNAEVELLNVPEAKGKTMTCDFFMSEEGEVITEAEYEVFVDFLPLEMAVTIDKVDEPYCQGDLFEALIEAKKKNNITTLPNKEDEDFPQWQKLFSGIIYGMVTDSDDNIYYLLQDNFNYLVSLYKYNDDISLVDNSEIQGKNSLFIDSQNNFYIWDGVAGFSEGNGGLYKYDSEWKEVEKFSEKHIISLTENDEGLWVATSDVLYLLNKSNIWTEYRAGDWGGSDNYNIKVVKGYGNYLLFQVGFDFYMYKDGSFEKLNIENLDILHDIAGNVYIKDNIAWFYSTWFTGGRELVKVNLDDYSYEEYLISSPEDGVNNDNMVIDSVVSGDDNDFWFLSHNYDDTDANDYYLVISHYKNNTLTHTKYSSIPGEIDRYADTLIFRDNNLYILFSNGFGFYKVDMSQLN